MEAFDWPGMTHPGSTKRKRPFGVTVLALVQVVSGIQMLGSGLWALAVASIAGTPEGAETLEATLSPWMAENAAAIFTVIGFGFLILAILSFLLARGYVKGLEKARVRGRKVAFYSILFAILSIVAGIILLFSPLWGALVLWWLLGISLVVENLALFLWTADPRTITVPYLAVAPMVGGMISSAVLTLLVIPAIYALVKGMELRKP